VAPRTQRAAAHISRFPHIGLVGGAARCLSRGPEDVALEREKGAFVNVARTDCRGLRATTLLSLVPMVFVLFRVALLQA
jgi:hypothetical protein